MSSKRVVAVLGATGVQGGAVVHYLSTQSGYDIRAITRNPDSKVAKRLSTLANVSVFKAHFLDPASLVAAFKGVEVVYALTNFYDPENQANPLQELEQGIIIADAAKEAGVQFFIWSTVPSALLRMKGRFESTRLVENKFYVSAYLKQINLPHIDLYLGFYYDNWINFGLVSLASDGTIQVIQPILQPETKIGMVWTQRDLGPTVDVVLKKYRTTPGLLNGEIYCVGGYNSTADFARELQKQTGKTVRIVGGPTTGFQDLDTMYEYYNRHSVYSEFELPKKESLDLGIRFHTLEDYVREVAVPYVNKLGQAE
ncbi:hypothetical protein LTR10_012699 [Elasticomyces elasticus]|uniref:NmrA-like domain-containing protein n=1 Tax=Exophiala sideris TaxID=1016849 RepID=A0ABR0JR77_9EURO|nr:hypothetical protein LTR10_012699 [Elasticomyces elasticus]KAK5034577.1 hypothetical protein LTR13_006232 [Exophiala sideris]KAK5040102.1 hypothetical protein LTS07_000599 [Exophiala sideris]KAK5068480.1 hypothetical protein LTR69_000600 [Exophiala sideris]KAK5187782.1 hypothetical protein LTR44_000600 [Eurotiomycetes sp. CCFEE 6388]